MINKKIKKELVRDAHFCGHSLCSRTKMAKYQGFYLIEAIIAIFLLTVGLLVTVDLLSKVMSNTMADRDNNTAVLLAQEGVELVRNMRDNNFAQGDEAFADVFPLGSRDKCQIDMDSTSIDNTKCGAAIVVGLWKNTDQFITHTDDTASGGKKTKFRRKVSIVYNGGAGTPDTATSMTITSAVSWADPSIVIPTAYPTDNVLTQCNVANKCTYARITLTKWE